jgi:probable F420-dependent oxidoreductase
MKLGFALPHVGPVATKENVRAVALEAEKLGYNSLWTLERTLMPVNPKTIYPGTPDGKLDPQYERVLEPLGVLTYVAAITDRIRLGTSVINLPFYNPLMLGKRIATLDQLSDGRVTLGIGMGWSEDETDAVNVPYKQRGRVFEEMIHALKAVWGPDPVEFHGTYFTIPASVVGPKPVQKPHPPLITGAFYPKALDRAGRLTDGFTGCCVPVDILINSMQSVKEAARRAGRNPDEMSVVIRCLVTRTDKPVEGPTRAVAVGTWEQIQEDMLRLQEAGVDEAFFDVSFQPDNTDQRSVLDYLTKFRGILDAVPAR